MLAGAAMAASLGVVGAASAKVYDAVADFSGSNPSGAYSYGTGVTGTDFTPYTNYNLDCLGAGTGCWQTATPVYEVPAVIKNFTGSTINTGTVVLPNDVLLVHPGPSTDSIVRFIVPTTGKYVITGSYELLDTNPSGVNVIIAFDNIVLFTDLLTGPGATHPGTPGESVAFSSGGPVLLHAGDFIDYGVNNAGSFFNDSTGLALTITSVPEPAAWALMLVGFAGLGGALRASRRSLAAAA